VKTRDFKKGEAKMATNNNTINGNKSQTQKRNTRIANVEVYYLDWKKAVLNPAVDHIAATNGVGYLPREYYRRVATMRIQWDPSDPLLALEGLWQSFNSKNGEHTTRGIREMCIGDFVTIDGIGWFCDIVGWMPLVKKNPLPLSGNPSDYTVAGDKFYIDNEEWEFDGATWNMMNNRNRVFNGPGVGLLRRLPETWGSANVNSNQPLEGGRHV